MTSEILFVCYANLCRSPMAEYIARDMLARQLGVDPTGVEVSSAGTHAMPGQHMHPHAATVAAGLGVDPTAFRSRPLTAREVAGAGLVLAATRRERAACVSLVPAAVHRTFTLRQFGRLAAAAGRDEPGRYGRPERFSRPARHSRPLGHGGPTGPEELAEEHREAAHARLVAAVSAVARARGRLQPVGPDADDLADPVGQPITAFRQCAVEIELALAPVVRLIASCG